MSGKGSGRKSNKRRRGRRRNPARIIVTAVCAAVLCAVVICAVSYGAGRIVERKEDVGETDMAAQDIREAEEQEILLKKEQNDTLADGEAAGNEAAVGTTQNEEGQGEGAVGPAQGEDGQEKGGDQAGASLSILGDSISTFRDYIPAGYYDFFPENGLVTDVNDTWWKRVLDETGRTLYVNGSSSGATCTGNSTDTASPQCGCNEFRTGALYGPNGAVPDVIIVYMGTNDLLQSVPMGDNDGTRQVAEGQVDAFSDAYTLILDKLLAKYPASKIYCCTIAQVGDYGTKTPYVEFVNGERLTAADYNAKITQIAANKNIPVIDLYNCGITVDNLHNTTMDGVHPTPDGMKYIAEAVRKVLD